MNSAAMTWDRMMNGSAESQASSDQGDYKVVAVRTVTGDFGQTSEIALIRERGSWYVQRPDYYDRYTSKKKAIAANPIFAGC